METKEIKYELEELENKLRQKIIDITECNAVNITGILQPDINMFLNKKRKWSYKKILDVAEKLGL